MKTGILGGGLSAVTLARHLDCECEIVEAADRPGGLCRTFSADGFLYDIGGHILFSKDDGTMHYVKEILDGNAVYQRRANKVLFKGRYVKYPFENDLAALEREDNYECLIGYLKNDHPPPSNFREWIYHTFGDGIAEKYLVPYNEKIWKEDLSNMALEWVERVPKPPLEDVVRSAVGISTEGYTHQLNFMYPDEGGIESLVRSSMRGDVPVVTSFTVKSICRKNGGWIVSDGDRELAYERLVLTFSVKDALRCLSGVPGEIAKAAALLKHNAVKVVMVGVNNESLLDRSAIYIPQRDVPFHRVCYMAYFSRKNAPPGKSSLIAEITTNSEHELHRVTDDSLIEMTVKELHRLGIIDRRDVCATDVHTEEYGYVVYDRDYSRSVAAVRDYLTGLGIRLLGRFAEFEYINMDTVIQRAVKMAGALNEMEARI